MLFLPALFTIVFAIPGATGPRVEKVENAGLLFTDNKAGVSGTDCGYSIPVGNRTLWLFGDVFLLHPTNPSRTYVGGVSNCGLLAPKGEGTAPLRTYAFITDDKTGIARQLIPNQEGEGNETRLWAFGGFHNSRTNRIYVFYATVHATGGGGPFDFRIAGHGLCRADATNLDDLAFQRLDKTVKGSPWWPSEGPLFGSAVVIPASPNDPYLYIVGVAEKNGKKLGRMARVRRDMIEQMDDYEYLAGSSDHPAWSKSVADSVDVEGLNNFPNELSVVYNHYLGGYLAVHSVDVDQKIRLSLSQHPWGPYRTLGEIGAPHRAFEKAFCYAGKEHPELAEQNGRVIYATYVDSQRYWLQMLKITLTKQPTALMRKLP